MSNRAAGGGIAGLGVVLAIVGVVLYAYPETTTLFGYTIYTTYPYRDTGTLLLVLGIILVVVGVIVSVIPSTSSSSPPQTQVGAYQQPGWQYGSAPTGHAMYCAYCGRPIAPGAVYCSGCGRSTQK